jgi:protein SCO1/2
VNRLARALFALSLLAAAPAAAAPAASPIDTHFALSTLDGRAVTDTDYRGKFLLIYFGYTFCPDVCPTTLSQIDAALDALGPQGARFQPLFISVDPSRDKPSVLKDYLANFRHIGGLAGSPEEIETVAKAFHAYYRARSLGNGEYAVDHSSYIYVIGPDGALIELLTGDLPDHPLDKELRRLLAKARA